jgi:hypothetical protein
VVADSDIARDRTSPAPADIGDADGTGRDLAAAGNPAELDATASALAEATHNSMAKRKYPAHSDGVVCRCAVHWRTETIERGLNRLREEREGTPGR